MFSLFLMSVLIIGFALYSEHDTLFCAVRYVVEPTTGRVAAQWLTTAGIGWGCNGRAFSDGHIYMALRETSHRRHIDLPLWSTASVAWQNK